jgi:hypothetical protein
MCTWFSQRFKTKPNSLQATNKASVPFFTAFTFIPNKLVITVYYKLVRPIQIQTPGFVDLPNHKTPRFRPF